MLLGRGGVTGTVRDLDGDRAPGARVLVTSQVDPASFFLTETDGQGRYQAPGIVVGPVAVKAVLGTSSGIAAGNIQRAGTFTTVDVTINLGPGRVTGGVFEREPELGTLTPIPAIEVYYLIPNPDVQGNLVAASDETAADGSFVFEGLPSGTFHILAIDRVALLEVDPEAAGYDGPRVRQYLTDALARLSAVPGVRATGYARIIPVGFGGSRQTIDVPGYAPKQIGRAHV